MQSVEVTRGQITIPLKNEMITKMIKYSVAAYNCRVNI